MSIIPAPIVWATPVSKMRKATKLKKAAQRTARRGDRTRVETTVAMELAASCMPFVKSKANATRMMKTTKRKTGAGHETQLALRMISSMTLATSSQRSAATSSRV